MSIMGPYGSIFVSRPITIKEISIDNFPNYFKFEDNNQILRTQHTNSTLGSRTGDFVPSNHLNFILISSMEEKLRNNKGEIF